MWLQANFYTVLLYFDYLESLFCCITNHSGNESTSCVYNYKLMSVVVRNEDVRSSFLFWPLKGSGQNNPSEVQSRCSPLIRIKVHTKCFTLLIWSFESGIVYIYNWPQPFLSALIIMTYIRSKCKFLPSRSRLLSRWRFLLRKVYILHSDVVSTAYRTSNLTRAKPNISQLI